MIERQAAGGVVYRRAGSPAVMAGGAAPAGVGDEPGRPETAVEVLMVLDAYGHWALPKGGIEPGESPEAAALREIREETGIVGAIEAPLPAVRYRFRDGDEEVDKTVHYFLVRALNTGLRVQREELRDAAWLPLDEAIRRCTYENLVPTLEAARQAIEERLAKDATRPAAGRASTPPATGIATDGVSTAAGSVAAPATDGTEAGAAGEPAATPATSAGGTGDAVEGGDPAGTPAAGSAAQG